MENMNTVSAVAKATNTTSEVTFISPDSFKTIVGATRLERKFNHKTGSWFMVDNNGVVYFIQQAIDITKPVTILVPLVAGQPDYSKACMVNTSEAEGSW